MTRPLATLFVSAASLASTGCVAVVAGAAAGYGAAQYVRNDDTRIHAASFPSVWAAALASMKDIGYPVALDARPGGEAAGRIDVNDAVVAVARQGPSTTSVSVRVGTFTTDAHRRTSASIHEGIQRRLPRN